MTSKTFLYTQVALGVLASLCVATGADANVQRKARPAPSAVALQRQIADLESAIQELESWRNAQTQQHDQDDQQIANLRQQLADAQARADAANAEARAQIQTIPGAVKSAIAAEQPKDGKLHLKGVTVSFGGFAAAEAVYRTRNEEADIGSSFAKIPFANSPLAHTQEARGTARQSRISMLAEGDIDPSTHAAFYSEFDFLAGPQTGNSNESNSFSPRIRNVYGAVDWSNLGVHLLAGQNWSLATMNSKGITPRNEVPPPTIDAQYVVGFTWARQPQVRLTEDFANKQVWAAVSVENPQTTLASAATGTTGTSVSGLTVTTGAASTSQFDSANTLSLNHFPDVIAKVAVEPDLFGSRPLHVEAYGMERSFYDRVNVTGANPLGLSVGARNENTNGWGVGGGVLLAAVPKLVDLQASALTGAGIGRYGSGQLPDAVVGADGALSAIRETMFMGGATLHATPKLDVYVFGGEERENSDYSRVGAGTFGFGSPAATLAGCHVEGGTCTADISHMDQVSAGLWDKVYQGNFGQVRVGFQYSYTQLTSFAGATGGAPTTNDNMFFTSFRYYPF